MKILLLLTLIGLSLLGSNPRAATLETLSTDQLDGLLPPAFIDQIGIEVPPEASLAIPGLEGMTAPIPLIPMFRKQHGSRKFLGVAVPAKYLKTECEKSRSGRNMIVLGAASAIFPPEVQNGMAMIRKVILPDGKKLMPIYHDCVLYGLHEDANFRFERSTSFGFSIEPSTGGNTLVLGKNIEVGSFFKVGPSPVYTQGSGGFNAASSFNQIFDGIDGLIEGENLLNLIDKTLLFTPYFQAYIAANAHASSVNVLGPVDREIFTDKISADYFKALIDPKKMPPAAPLISQPVEESHLSSELQEALQNIRKKNNLTKEVKWVEKVAGSVGAQLVVNDAEANQFLQRVCDHVASGYNLPKELWPRCAIAATLLPNAWAYPGGNIFFTAGIIGILQDLDGLLLVLGHEIGHVVGRHTSKRMPKMQAYQYAATAVGLAENIALTGFSLQGGMGAFGDVSWGSWWFQSNAAAMAGQEVINRLNQVLFFAPAAALMANSRSHEWQSDRFGQEIAFATGSDSTKMYEGWNQFEGFIRRHFPSEDKFLTRIFASHPNGAERLRKVAERTKDIEDRLGHYHQVNRLHQSVYDYYKTLHEKYRPWSEKWGQHMSALIKKQNEQGRARAATATSMLLSSFLAPGSSCIVHALSGSGALDSLSGHTP